MKFAIMLNLVGILVCFSELVSSGDDLFARLEANPKVTENEKYSEDLTEIKYLKEKIDTLRAENKYIEASNLERRVKRKIEVLNEEIEGSISRGRASPDFDSRPGRIDPSEFEARMRERESQMREKFQKDKDNFMRDGKFRSPPDTDSFGASRPGDMHDLHNLHRQHSMGDMGNIHKDISERHKELIDHRKKDLTERIEKAGFSPNEEARLKSDLESYLSIEKEVMESRAVDKSPERDRSPKTAEERSKEREEMKARRDSERAKMEQAREMRKGIDAAIREKLMAGREF